jgi:hypothetical protein
MRGAAFPAQAMHFAGIKKPFVWMATSSSTGTFQRRLRLSHRRLTNGQLTNLMLSSVCWPAKSFEIQPDQVLREIGNILDNYAADSACNRIASTEPIHRCQRQDITYAWMSQIDLMNTLLDLYSDKCDIQIHRDRCNILFRSILTYSNNFEFFIRGTADAWLTSTR